MSLFKRDKPQGVRPLAPALPQAHFVNQAVARIAVEITYLKTSDAALGHLRLWVACVENVFEATRSPIDLATHQFNVVEKAWKHATQAHVESTKPQVLGDPKYPPSPEYILALSALLVTQGLKACLDPNAPDVLGLLLPESAAVLAARAR